MRKRTVAIPLSVLAAAAGLAGGAFADSQSPAHPHKASGCRPERAVIRDAARRLHITPTRLTDALKQAVIDQIDAAVPAGHLNRTQAKAIKRQIEQSPGLAFGPGVLAPEIKAAHVIATPGWPAHGLVSGPPRLLPAPGRVRVQVRAPVPSACFAAAGPASLSLRTSIGRPKKDSIH